MSFNDATEHKPISAQVFQILLAVSDKQLHGYAIIQDIKRRTEGRLTLTASTLYSAIKRLARRGDRAAIGTVAGYLGGGRYRVQVAGSEYEVPAAGDAQAMDGQSVALMVSGETGRPIAMLGPVRPMGV